MGSVWGNRMTQVQCLPDKHTMADCFVIIQFPQEVFEIPQGFIRAFVKAILLGKDDSFSISSCWWRRVCRICWNAFSIRDNPLNLLTLSFLRAVWYSLKNKVSDKNWLGETNMVPVRHLRERLGRYEWKAKKLRGKIPRRSKKEPRRLENFSYYYQNVQKLIKYLTAIL